MVTVRDIHHLHIWLAPQSKWKMKLQNPGTDLDHRLTVLMVHINVNIAYDH